MPPEVIDEGDANGIVAAASAQYDRTPAPVLPEVILAEVISIEPGVQTAAGFVMIKAGAGLTVTTDVAVSSHPNELVPVTE